jgi:hypothetical protein
MRRPVSRLLEDNTRTEIGILFERSGVWGIHTLAVKSPVAFWALPTSSLLYTPTGNPVREALFGSETH